MMYHKKTNSKNKNMYLGTGTLLGTWIELNGIRVRALPGPVHLGLRTGPLFPVFFTELEEPCSFSKVPDGPYI